MKLADQLREISVAPENERPKLVHEFHARIRGHREEGILTLCLNAAAEGEYKAFLTPCHYPVELTEEGIVFTTFYGNLFACWNI